MKKYFVFVCLTFFMFSACNAHAEDIRAAMEIIGLNCSKFKGCQEMITSSNPESPEFRVLLPSFNGGLYIGKMMREKFGDRVFIEYYDAMKIEKIKMEDYKKELTFLIVFKSDIERLTVNPVHYVERTLQGEVATTELERAFSAKGGGVDSKTALYNASVIFGESAIAWIDKEVEIQRKKRGQTAGSGN